MLRTKIISLLATAAIAAGAGFPMLRHSPAMPEGGDPPATLPDCQEACASYCNITTHCDYSSGVLTGFQGECEWITTPTGHCETEIDCGYVIGYFTIRVAPHGTCFFYFLNHPEWDTEWYNASENAVNHTFSTPPIDDCGTDELFFVEIYDMSQTPPAPFMCGVTGHVGCTRCE